MRAERKSAVRYYRSYTDEFVESRQQDFLLPENYTWVHTSPVYRAVAQLLYGAAFAFEFFYARFALHIKVVGRDKLKGLRDTGYFLYGNHTQPIGDAFAPAQYAFPKRIYAVAGTANLGIPVLGRLLPMLGALIIPDSVRQMKDFLGAVQYHLAHKSCIVIYPEAHVWPYCGFVRPFPATSFRFPVEFGVPAYCMTTTYQKRAWGKKPRATVFIDGPFVADGTAGRKAEQKRLHDEIYACMQARSKAGTYDYIRYEKEAVQ